MNDFKERPKAGKYNVITPEQWRKHQPSAETMAHAQEIRRRREAERAAIMQEFIDEAIRRDARRHRLRYVLAPFRVLRDVARAIKGAR